MRTSLRRALVVTAAAGLALAAAPIVDASASAQAAGQITVCSNGGYASYAAFPGRGGWATYVASPGSCVTLNAGGNVNERVDVYTGWGQYIASTIYNGTFGETIVTVAGPSFYAYNG